MALLHYLKLNGDTSAMLPDLRGTSCEAGTIQLHLSCLLMRRCMFAQGTEATKRGVYAKFTPAQKAEIGKRAAEHDMAATVQYAIGMVNGYFYVKKNFS